VYFAKQSVDRNLPIYISIFKRLSEGDTFEGQREIDEVIVSTKKISVGSLDIYAARADYYFLVSLLLSNGKDFLAGFDGENIGVETYRGILGVLRGQLGAA